MVLRLRFVLVLIGNALVALSALASLGAYTSGDASGLQYVLLEPAAGLAILAVLAGGLLAFLSLHRPVAWANLVLAIVALLLALLPQATGLGYNGAVLDRPGAVLAAALLLITIPTAMLGARRLGVRSA